ncbi:MAG: DNA primase [Peptococcaceae bacterium]|jgi:DNA primase|nr:DNA primase [Peptococcaceae bacterium]
MILASRIPEDVIDHLRHRSDIVEIIGEYVSLKKKGQNYVGLCPFHEEKTPSFVVSLQKQIFHCFGCGKGGNVFTFLMEKDGLSFIEAAEKLAKRYGVELPKRPVNEAWEQKNAQRQRMFSINQWAADYFQEVLYSSLGRSALDYLRKRGLEESTLKRFSLGFTPPGWDGLSRALTGKGVTEAELISLGLAQKNQRGGLTDRFRNRVMFPIMNETGQTVGFGGRVMDDGQPKYLNSPETPLFEKGRVLYGLNLARGAVRGQDQIILMEGYMDVIAAHQYGVTQSVASLGTALTQEQARQCTRYTYHVLLCFDSDPAGESAALRGIEILEAQGCKIGLIQIPEAKDPDEILRKQGKEAFVELTQKAISGFEYKFNKNMEKFDSDHMTGKIQIIQAMIPDLARVDSPVTRQSYVTMISEKLLFPEDAILSELLNFQKHRKTEPAQVRSTRSLSADQALERARRLVFKRILTDGQSLAAVREAGGAELFGDRLVRQLYLTLDALLQAGYQVRQGEDLVALLDQEDMRECLTALLLEEDEPGDEAKWFRDCLNVLRKDVFERGLRLSMEQLAQYEKQGNVSAAVEMLARIHSLNIEKQRIR